MNNKLDTANNYLSKSISDSILKGPIHNNNSLFIWGNFSQVYYYTKYKPATPFVVCEYIIPYWNNRYSNIKDFDINTLNSQQKENYNIMLDSLYKNKPDYIVDTSDSKHFKYWNIYKINKLPEFYTFLQNEYKLYLTIDGIKIYHKL